MYDKKQEDLWYRVEKGCFLGMEDHYSPCWPAASAEANWVQSNAAGVYEESFLVPWTLQPHPSTSATFHIDGLPSWSIPIQEAAEDRAASSVSKSHSQAEKRRRDRINAQLGTLRKLIPRSEKVYNTPLSLSSA